MKKVKFFWKYPIEIDIETNKNVEVYIDTLVGRALPKDVIRILILQEPYSGELYWTVKEFPQRYTYILTYRQELLDSCSNAIKFLGSNTWIWGYSNFDKKFCISMVVGGKIKEEFPGYSLRQRTWWSKELITNPIEFYLSDNNRWAAVDYMANLVLGTTKDPLFDSQFHIAIENLAIKNMFTEKLIDCFQAKTVPIYYGCSNIGDYFNTKGMILVNGVNDIIEACNKLTPHSYEKMLPAIEDNYNRSGEWCNYNDQVERAVRKLI